jgi:hypothetical protein
MYPVDGVELVNQRIGESAKLGTLAAIELNEGFPVDRAILVAEQGNEFT